MDFSEQEKTHDVPKFDRTVRLPADHKGGAVIGHVDRYALLQKLGEGSFGAVYRARDEVADVEVALKALPRIVAHSPDELDRVRENFKLVAKLRHPNIANVLHLHKVEDADAVAHNGLGVSAGDHIIVMDYLRGLSLSSWRRQFPGERVPLEEATPICKQIAGALDYAHQHGIIHRDIKPANVMITAKGEVGILDFGLAAEIHLSMSHVSGLVGDRSGTPIYMAPEQWMGRSQGPATDQYALGVVIYELLAGHVPFSSVFETNSPLLMYNAVKREIPEPISELSRRENEILLRALAKRGRDRFGSCSEFVGTLAGEVRFRRRHARPIDQQQKGSGVKQAILLLLCVILAAAGGYMEAERRNALRVVQAEEERQAAAAQEKELFEKKLAEATAAFENEANELARRLVAEILEREPGHPKALLLRDKITQAVGELTVVPVQSDAKVKWQRVQMLDGGQGFSESLKKGQEILAAANALYAVKEYDKALEKYRQLLTEYERLQALDAARQSATRDRQTAEAARGRAGAADAEKDAAEVLAGATQLAESAETAFQEGRFTDASKLWVAAVAEYAKAEAFARGAQAVRFAESAYNEALKEVDVALLGEFGGAEWVAVMQQAEEADRLAAEGKWDAAAQRWTEATDGLPFAEEAAEEAQRRAGQDDQRSVEDDPLVSARVATAIAKAEEAKADGKWEDVLAHAQAALAENDESVRAKELRKEAEAALMPKLTIVAVADGQDLQGAEVSIDGAVQDVKTPTTIDLVRDHTYLIRVALGSVAGGKRYLPYESLYRVEAAGAQTLRAVLRPVTLHADLTEAVEAEFADLDGLAHGSEEAMGRQREAVQNQAFPLQVRTQKTGIALRLVPTGDFLMGRSGDDVDDAAMHRVVLSRPLYAGMYEVTRRQWETVMGRPVDSDDTKNDDLPVEGVSWKDCQEFCAKLCQAEGVAVGTYRLPTEAEWEYLARAGITAEYATGDGVEEMVRVGWFAENSAGGARLGGQKRANAWGLYDFSGNVNEWCRDWYGDYSLDAVTDPTGPADGTERVIRGGSWSDDADACRTTARHRGPADDPAPNTGLRIVREIR